MKITLPLFVLGFGLAKPALVQAQPGLPPALNPGVTNAAAQRAQQSNVAYWYGLLPPQIFSAFGNANRLELLQDKSTIYDANGGFIEVLVPGDPNQNDVEKLQVKLFQGNKGLMVGVSQIVWNQPKIKGALAFFALGQDGQLFDVTRQVFPFDLNAPQTPTTQAPVTDAPAADKKGAPPVNAYLPRRGTLIESGVAESETASDSYAWNGDVFRLTEQNQGE